jgi:rhamnogalacturonyl hydrolase YesR
MDNMVNQPNEDYWTWIDAIFMSMPALAKLSAVKGDTRYSEEAYKLYSCTKNTMGLYNASNSLWWRDADFKGGNVYWSRGNGWVLDALVRVLSELPETDAHYNEYKDMFIQMTAALKSCQRSDGFWNPDLLNPNNYGGKETTGTALFAYGMAWGINNGILKSEEYLPCVTKAWNGIIKDSLHSNGFLGWVQGTGKQPSDGQPLSYDNVPNFEDYGLGAFLLAGSEVYKLAGQ